MDARLNDGAASAGPEAEAVAGKDCNSEANRDASDVVLRFGIDATSWAGATVVSMGARGLALRNGIPVKIMNHQIRNKKLIPFLKN